MLIIVQHWLHKKRAPFFGNLVTQHWCDPYEHLWHCMQVIDEHCYAMYRLLLMQIYPSVCHESAFCKNG